MKLPEDGNDEDNLERRLIVTGLDRRTFLRLLSLSGLSGLLASCSRFSPNSTVADDKSSRLHIPPGQTVARFPEKEELILLTDRPPQLETPLFYFRQDLTPNEAFFVRWHMEGIPTLVDLSQFTLNVSGHVETPLALSMDDLRTKFPQQELVAVVQCSGNSRSFFQPRVAGGQWQNGAVGNARWKGARLKDILKKAGVKAAAVDVSFAGMDEAPLSTMPKFVKSLPIDQAMDDNILVAYEMNGSPLPMLNGFPLRLVVPGWFATYWVKSLQEITVLPSKFEGFWMDKTYRVPKNANAEESPENLAKDTVPIGQMNIRSLFVRPDAGDVVRAGKWFDVEGIAFDGGGVIKKVEVSTDNGSTWAEASIISADLGKYSFYRFRYSWNPPAAGTYKLMVKASNAKGETQSMQAYWNKSGYMRNVVESMEVHVV